MSDTKEYAALQEECERLRAENQRLNKCLARYRAKCGELSELDKGGEIGALSAVEIKSGESKVHAPSSNVVLVTNQNPSEEKIKLFCSLFRGREDIYAKRWHSEKSGKSGYQPVCLNEWNTWLCDKRRTKCSECKNRKFAPLDDGAIYKHLQGKSPNGTDIIGIYPLTEDENCWFLAMDFDGSSWEDDIVAVRAVCKKHEIPFLVERSRSGLGGHVWFFFADKVCAVNARKFGTLLLNGAMQMRHSIRFSAYDRLFPNQDYMPKGGFGNLIALPLQGMARRRGNSVFVDENFVPYSDQWQVLSSVSRIDVEKLKEWTDILSVYSASNDFESPAEEDAAKAKNGGWAAEDFPPIVRIIVSDMIYVEKKGLSERALWAIKRMGAYANPEFYKAQKMRLPTYDKPRYITVYEENDLCLAIPRGRMERLRSLLKEAGAQFSMEDRRNAGTELDVVFQGTLRDEQEKAFAALSSRDIGVLSATTAFGKTVVGARMIAAKRRNSLVLVHTSALLNQWKAALSKFLSFGYSLPEQPKKRGRKKELSHIGQLGATKNTLNGKLDIAIIQSLGGKNGVKEVVKNYGLVLVDECHHVPALMFEQVLKSVNAKYVYGLTATPVRADGRQESIFMQCGEIAYKVDAIEQAQRQLFDHIAVPRFTDFRMPLAADSGFKTLNQIFAELCLSKNRNAMIVDDVVKAVNTGRMPIVLTERTEHAKLLTDAIEHRGIKTFLLIGKEAAKLKREKLAAIAAAGQTERFVIVAVGRYVGEGFDFARLDTLFLAMPISWKGKLTQYAGRLHRDYVGKREVVIYDYVDLNVFMLENMYHKRIKGYKDIGYEIRVDAKTGKRGILFNKTDFKRIFNEDITSAHKEILIVSPSLIAGRVTKFLRVYSTLLDKPNVTVVTRATDDEKTMQQLERLKRTGIAIQIHDDLHLRCAVIDGSLVWYGSISPLGCAGDTDSSLRFDSREIAEMLVSQLNPNV